MRNLITLVIKESLISDIKTGMFDDLVSLKSLTLSWNCIKTIEPDSFAKLTDLEILDLSGNSIDRIHTDLLKSLKKLVSLDLSFNRSQMLIKFDVFDSLIHLQKLNLNTKTKLLKSKATQLSQSFFRNLQSIKHLSFYLDANLVEGDFENLKNLLELEIRCKNSKCISLSLWKNWQNLKKLSIVFNNQVEKTVDNILDKLECLEELDILCGIKINLENFQSKFPNLKKLRLREGLGQIQNQKGFNTLPLLQELILKGNRFDRNILDLEYGSSLRMLNVNDCFLRQVTFQNDSLEELYLDENGLNSIDAHTFSTLNNLRILSLKSNKINSIDAEAFKHQVNLVELDLSLNEIVSIHTEMFSTLKNLKNLILNRNKISNLDTESVFDSLVLLEELDLRGNDLISIDSRVFACLVNLRLLVINQNLNLKFDYLSLNSLGNLRYLFLDEKDDLTCLNYRLRRDIVFYENFLNFHSLSISNKAFLLKKESNRYWS
jgi:Leucine-rich repeat (LRR) protein